LDACPCLITPLCPNRNFRLCWDNRSERTGPRDFRRGTVTSGRRLNLVR
jgi:hypothetical protein